MIRKLIFFEKGVETLSYFSRQLADALALWGYQSFFYDISGKERSLKHAVKFIKAGETAVITFNFIGLSGEAFLEEKNGSSIWENYGLPVYCILVDHPLYYQKQLKSGIKNLRTFCIDRQHVEYMGRFFPEIPCAFLPLAGNLTEEEYGTLLAGGDVADKLRSQWIPYGDREFDVAFIANYVKLPSIEEHFTSQTQEYIDFYHEILNDLRLHPQQPLDPVFEKFIKREVGEASEEELQSAYYGMLFLDMYNRTYFRERTVRTLVDSGVKVHVFGKDWEKLSVKHPENLICSGRQLDSAGCVQVLQNARIALNTMPWFKDGAHDRIFTAMLHGAVSLTDPSIYLKERFRDGRELRFYELAQLDQIAEIAKEMLALPKETEYMAQLAFETAVQQDTWMNRAEKINHMSKK
ncbi:MAG: glycosyltransferase [Roseburia sp.]